MGRRSCPWFRGSPPCANRPHDACDCCRHTRSRHPHPDGHLSDSSPLRHRWDRNVLSPPPSYSPHRKCPGRAESSWRSPRRCQSCSSPYRRCASGTRPTGRQRPRCPCSVDSRRCISASHPDKTFLRTPCPPRWWQRQALPYGYATSHYGS